MLLLLIFSNFVFAAKSLTSLKTLEFDAEETQTLNSKEKTLKYSVAIEFPNKVRKEMQFPSLNKGEIYVYNGERKQIYLPIFDEYKETKTDADENRIIQAINKIKELEKLPETKKDYHDKKLKEFFINSEENITVFIKEYVELEGYLLPKEIQIKDKDINVGTLKLENIKINPNLAQDSFELIKK